MTKARILILGGTTEARRLAEALAQRSDVDATLSLAGRTADPQPQALPTRVGGFGGSDGLTHYLATEEVDLLIDATHPFANAISANAAAASRAAGVAAIALRRPPWSRLDGDRWHSVTSMAEAAAALGQASRRVFLSIGRQEAHSFNVAPQHAYVIRSIDPVEPPLDVPQSRYILSAGPFDVAGETALLHNEEIDVIVTKNSGGQATYAKIEAARNLGIDVIMVERRAAACIPTVETVDAVLAHLDQILSGAMKRGV